MEAANGSLHVSGRPGGKVNKKMTELEQYYNKFSEDKRLTRRHGQVEYRITMKYIYEYLQQMEQPAVLEVGAGTGRYCVQLAEEGYHVTAVELVKYNLGMLKAKGSSVKAYQGNAKDLSRFAADAFDLTLVLGPMYHLYTTEDKIQALAEAKRVTKPQGIIMVAYCMNEYGVLIYGFREGNVKACLEDGRLTADFRCVPRPKDLYAYIRLEDIDKMNQVVGLKRQKIIAPDGPANYMRRDLRLMDEETFELFVQYQMSVCERQDLLGASAHVLDILQKN